MLTDVGRGTHVSVVLPRVTTVVREQVGMFPACSHLCRWVLFISGEWHPVLLETMQPAPEGKRGEWAGITGTSLLTFAVTSLQLILCLSLIGL